MLDISEEMHLEGAIGFYPSGSFSVSAEAVPMVDVTCLSNIWLPSHLFQNQGKYFNSNLNKPGIFHTLQKPVVTDCFSIYSDLNVQNNERENCPSPVPSDSSGDFSHADMLHLLNDSPSKPVNQQPEDGNLVLYSDPSHSNPFQNCSPYQRTTTSSGDKCGTSTSVKSVSYNLIDSLEDIFSSDDEELTHDFSHLNPGANQRPTIEESVDRQRIEKEFPSSDSFKNSELTDNFNVDTLDNKVDATQKETIVEYPIAYQRPTIEETVGKQKNQKKKKKAPKKTLSLNQFLPEKNFNDIPLRDEFYESVMRQKHQHSYASEYPSLREDAPYFEDPELAVIDTQDQILSEMVKEESEPELNDLNIHTIMITHIPPEVTEQQLQEFVLGYGDLKTFSLESCGEFLQSKIEMDFHSDIDWIIDCLNGSSPFGNEVVRCYKVC